MLGDSYREFVSENTVSSSPLVNAALGLCGEVAEAVDEARMGADPTSELGDVVFYVAMMANTLGITDADLETYSILRGAYVDTSISRLHHHSGMLAELVKKLEFHGKLIPADTYAEHLAGVLNAVESLGGWYKASLESIQDANVAKLKARWPNGFGK